MTTDHPKVLGPDYQARCDARAPAGTEPCALCGRPTRWTHVLWAMEDCSILPWGEVSDDPDTDYGEYLGWVPVGARCRKRLDPRYVRRVSPLDEEAPP